MSPNSNFRLTRDHRFFAKNGIHCYGTKSWWGPPWIHLGANGVPLGPKNGSNRKKLPCPKIRHFPFFAKNGSYGYGAQSQWAPIWVHLGPMGSHWVQKMGQTLKITMPQNSFFRLSRGHRFFAKNGIYGYDGKSRWGPLRVHLGSMGSHQVKKMGQNRKKLPCPKIRIFDYPVVIDFSQTIEVMVMAPNHGGEPLGSNLGPMGSHCVQKMGQNGKKLPCLEIEFSTTPRSSIFRKKWKLRLWCQITVGTS